MSPSKFLVRRPDPLRWDLARLSKVISDEDTLTVAGLSEWETTLCREEIQSWALQEIETHFTG